MTQPEESETITYAGFWRRFNAYGIDATILFIVAWMLDACFANSALAQSPEELKTLTDAVTALQTGNVSPELRAIAIESVQRSMLGGSIIPGPSALLMGSLSAIYNILFAAGTWQATPGKHWLGIKIVMTGGRRLTLLESTIRHTVTGLSMAPLGLGYITMLFTKQNLALHDIICNTRVIRVKKMGT